VAIQLLSALLFVSYVCSGRLGGNHVASLLSGAHGLESSALFDANTCMQAFLWMTVGLLLYAGMIVACSLHFYNVKRANLVYTPGQYLHSHRLGYFVSIERGIWSVLSFAIWFRLLKCATPLVQCRSLSHISVRVIHIVEPFQG
jgi:hypothetical protein